MATSNAICVLRAAALNGESPVWHCAESRLYWVDIKGSMLHVFDPASGADRSWQMPGWIGCLALTTGGAVVALRTGLHRFDCASGALEFIAPAPYDSRRFTFNDGRCDPRGRLFVGLMYDALGPGDQAPAAPRETPLWRYDGDGRWGRVDAPAKISNGLAWSPDGRVLYHADTARKTIWAHDYDAASGTIENRRVFASIEEGGDGGGPDGASVDRDGFYICAVFGAGCLLRFDPDGRLERRIEMPAQYVTMPGFGGDDLGTIYVTSAGFHLNAQQRAQRPDEGSLFAVEAPVPGLPPSHFDERVEAYAAPAASAVAAAAGDAR